MASLTYIASIARPRNCSCCCSRKAQRYHTDHEINLYAAYHVVHEESTIQSRRPLQQPTRSLQNCHAHSLDRKNTLANSHPI